MSKQARRKRDKMTNTEIDLWLYEQKLRGLTLDQLRTLAALPVELGGIGFERSISTIWLRLEKRLAARIALLGDSVEAERLIRIERLERQYYDLAKDTTSPSWQARHSAHKGLIAITLAQSKLMGLDAPIKIASTITVVDNMDLELQALIDNAKRADRKAAGEIES